MRKPCARKQNFSAYLFYLTKWARFLTIQQHRSRCECANIRHRQCRSGSYQKVLVCLAFESVGSLSEISSGERSSCRPKATFRSVQVVSIRWLRPNYFRDRGRCWSRNNKIRFENIASALALCKKYPLQVECSRPAAGLTGVVKLLMEDPFEHARKVAQNRCWRFPRRFSA